MSRSGTRTRTNERRRRKYLLFNGFRVKHHFGSGPLFAPARGAEFRRWRQQKEFEPLLRKPMLSLRLTASHLLRLCPSQASSLKLTRAGRWTRDGTQHTSPHPLPHIACEVVDTFGCHSSRKEFHRGRVADVRVGVVCAARMGRFVPHGCLRPSIPRAARSHSASVGKRPPAHAQYAAASYQLTQPPAGWDAATALPTFPAPWSVQNRHYSTTENCRIRCPLGTRRYSSTVTG